MIDACICTIGDEILIGQIIDTNSAYISKFLNQIGVKVSKIVTIGDNFTSILSLLEELTDKFQIIIITGGLGPTKDDVTKRALSTFFNSTSFHYDEIQLNFITEIVKLRGISLSQINKDQALVPDNSKVINNFKGTAPGLFFKKVNKGKSSLLFSLPGVPYEMESLLSEVAKHISKEFATEQINHKTIVLYGIAESALAEKLERWEESLPSEIKLAYLPNPLTGIKLRLSKYGGNLESNQKIIERYLTELKEILGELIYGEEDDTLQKVIVNRLKKEAKTLSIAESCTGGMISALVTSIPGASQVFMGGTTVYSNNSKIELLGVNSHTIEKYGAVSRECAEEMAEGVRKRLDTDIALSVTGIAGPGGGTKEKPVGTVCIAIATPNYTLSKEYVYTGDRERNITRFSSQALNLLRVTLFR